MPIFKVWNPDDPDSPNCYVQADNDGRAIIHAFLHEDGETFQDGCGVDALGKLTAAVIDIPALTMKTLRAEGLCAPFCAFCHESFHYDPGVTEGELTFCDEHCQQAFRDNPTNVDEPEQMICLYQDW